MPDKAEILIADGEPVKGTVRLEFTGPSTPLELDALTRESSYSLDWGARLFLESLSKENLGTQEKENE